MELLKLKVRESWGHPPQVHERSGFRYSDAERMLEWLETNYADGVLEPNKTVNFSADVVFPRRKFQASYSTNKLVSDPNKADILIVDSTKMTKYMQLYAYNLSYDNIAGVWQRGHGFNKRWGTPPADTTDYYVMDEPAERLKQLYDKLYSQKESKIIVDIRNVNLETDNYIDDATYTKINSMLASSQDDLKNLAMRLLTAFNYETEKVKIAMLLNTNWQSWKRCNDKKMSVETKTLLANVRRDFPNFDREDVIGMFQFWFKIVLDNEELKQAKTKMKDLIKHHMPDVPEFEIIKT